MPLFTGKGDQGTTQLFGGGERILKSSACIEALGTVDEINALVGVIKEKSAATLTVGDRTFSELLDDVQQDLFVVQAELAGAPKKMTVDHVKKIEMWIAAIERELPPITSFFVSGGTEIAAFLDFARTVARRAERRVVACLDESIGPNTEPQRNSVVMSHEQLFAYMNRLSSLLYALARLANYRAGVVEERPHY